MKKVFLSVIISALMLSASGVYADEPVLNVSQRRHPNIAAAQKLSVQAYYMIERAQEANGHNMEGHAKKAKELLEQVNEELKLAAQAANRNGRR